MSFNKDVYDHFRVGVYNPNEPLVPWTLKAPSEVNAENNWMKTVRPSAKDYRNFKDENSWLQAKESFEATIEAHGLDHLIDTNFIVTDERTDLIQRKWLYKVLQDTMDAPMAKQIVTSHKELKNTREIWKEICEHYDESMSSLIKAQAISSYLASTKLHQINWRGMKVGFISHWMEQSRRYNLIAERTLHRFHVG